MIYVYVYKIVMTYILFLSLPYVDGSRWVKLPDSHGHDNTVHWAQVDRVVASNAITVLAELGPVEQSSAGQNLKKFLDRIPQMFPRYDEEMMVTLVTI